MNAQAIVDYAKANGGGTFSEGLGAVNPEFGFFVSVEGKERRVKTLDRLVVSFYLKAHQVKFAQYLGIWFFEGDWYLDITEWFMSESEAKRVARFRDQKTYWDCAKKEAKKP